ncbi:hypothetical protein K2P97_02220 [bacterium]|nr:hypothetical protein [bacterium]
MIFSLAGQAGEFKIPKEKVAQLVEKFRANTKADRANLVFEFIYKDLKLNYPVCVDSLLKEKLMKCEKFNCISTDSFGESKFVKELLIRSGAEQGTCLVKTPYKVFTVKQYQWESFAKVFNDVLSEKSGDSFAILAQTAKSGLAKKEVTFLNNGKDCKFNIYYSFAVNKTGLIKSSKQIKQDGFFIDKEDPKYPAYYTEDGVTYEKSPSDKKNVFFYPKVKFIENLQKSEKACERVNNLFPYILETLNQVEHLRPDEIN